MHPCHAISMPPHAFTMQIPKPAPNANAQNLQDNNLKTTRTPCHYIICVSRSWPTWLHTHPLRVRRLWMLCWHCAWFKVCGDRCCDTGLQGCHIDLIKLHHYVAIGLLCNVIIECIVNIGQKGGCRVCTNFTRCTPRQHHCKMWGECCNFLFSGNPHHANVGCVVAGNVAWHRPPREARWLSSWLLKLSDLHNVGKFC